MKEIQIKEQVCQTPVGSRLLNSTAVYLGLPCLRLQFTFFFLSGFAVEDRLCYWICYPNSELEISLPWTTLSTHFGLFSSFNYLAAVSLPSVSKNHHVAAASSIPDPGLA
jgi:hypothetical protein